MAFIALTAPLYINAKQYGCVGDGVTDDTAALQAALTAAGTVNGSAVFLPQGIYLVSATLLITGNTSLVGVGDTDSGSIIRVKTGTALTTPVLASSSWNSNATTSGFPVRIADIQIDGNSATSGTAAHGIVAMNYWSSFERISISGVAGDGFQFTAHTKNGTHITNTCNEPKISRLQIRNVGGTGIRVNDSGSPLNSCTDGFLQDCIVQNTGNVGINIDMGGGWLVSGNHLYAINNDGLDVSKCYATRILNNYIEGFGGTGAAINFAGIGLSLLNGRGTVCSGNTVNFEGNTASAPFAGIYIAGSGTGTTVCHLDNNLVVGSNQSGSKGYQIAANPSQFGFPYIVYFGQNDAQGVVTAVSVDSHTTGGDIVALNHLTSFAINSPTAAAGANAGTTPPAPVLTNCSDVDGQITFGTGTVPTLGSMVVATFAKPYATPPRVLFTPINDATAALRWNVASTTTNFTYKVGVAPAASQANTVYGFHYHVLA